MSAYSEASIHILADSGLVSDVIADVEAYPEWASQMRAARVLSTDEGDWPEQVEFVLDAGIFKDTYVLEYTWDLEEDGQGVVSWSLARGKALSVMDGSYTLTGNESGTQVVYRLAVDSKLPLPSVIKRQAEKGIVAGALEGLKRRCES